MEDKQKLRARDALLEAAAQITPVPGNAQNSYLTMRSKDGNICTS